MRYRNIDILCIRESWLLQNVSDNYVQIPDYNIFRCDSGRGGGVCIYVKEVLSVNVINLNIPKQEGIEDIWVTIQCRKLPSFIIGCMYRHPKAPVTVFSYIQDVFKSISMKNKLTFIVGDFNDDFLSNTNKMDRIIKSVKMTQMVDKATRVTPTSSTLLDLFITNTSTSIISCDVLPIEIADHDLISVQVDISKPKRTRVVRTYRDLRNYVKEDFCLKLLDNVSNFNRILNTDDVDTQVDIFTRNFNKCLNECAPFVTKEVRRPFAPWMSDEVQNAINTRNNIHKKLKADRHNPILQEEYKQEKKKVKSLIENAKVNFYHEKFEENRGNISKIWKTIKEIVPSTKNNVNTQTFDNEVEKAKEFNVHFANVGKVTFEKTQNLLHGENVRHLHDVTENLNNFNVNNNEHAFRAHLVDTETVILTIKSLNDTSSVGCDGIPMRFIKDSLYVLAFYLTCIINTSVVTGISLLLETRCRSSPF